MVPREAVQVLGSSAFHDTNLTGRVELLGGNFPFTVDVRVAEVVEHVLGADPARRDALIDLLGVDLDWHMHAVSDGQRRRVQVSLVSGGDAVCRATSTGPGFSTEKGLAFVACGKVAGGLSAVRACVDAVLAG